jgi:hypothetical protein
MNLLDLVDPVVTAGEIIFSPSEANTGENEYFEGVHDAQAASSHEQGSSSASSNTDHGEAGHSDSSSHADSHSSEGGGGSD